MERVNIVIHLGIWIPVDMTWNTNISELCERTYTKIKLLIKLKYVRVSMKELVEIYCLFIKSVT